MSYTEEDNELLAKNIKKLLAKEREYLELEIQIQELISQMKVVYKGKDIDGTDLTPERRMELKNNIMIKYDELMS